MRKSVLTFLLAIAIQISFAQNYYNMQSPWSFSLGTSGTVTYFKVKSAMPVPNSAIVSEGIIASVDYQFNDYFSISPAIIVSGKGGQTEYIYGLGMDEVQYELGYVEQSLRFIGHIPVGQQSDIFLGAGPYYAYGFWGQATDNADGSTRGIKFGRHGDFKSNDYGASTLIGFNIDRRYIISLGFDLGLVNVHQTSPVYLNSDQFMNRAFNISFGYGF